MRHALWLAILVGCAVLRGQAPPAPPDVNGLNNQIAQKLAELEGDFPQGTTDTTAKMGPNPGGGCYIEVTVTSKNDPSAVRSFIIAFVDDHFCKNYILQQEQDGTVKLVPMSIPFNPFNLPGKIQQILGNIGNTGAGQSNHPEQESHIQPAVTAHQASDGGQSFPDVLPLPFAPPLSAGVTVTSSNGCDPGQTYLYFRVNHFDNSVTRYDGCPMQITATIPVTATKPLQAALTPDNSTLIVTSYNHGITFIDTSTNRVTKTLTTDTKVYPSGIAIGLDGSVAYVTSLIDDFPQVVILDVKNQQVVGSIPIPDVYPHSVYFSPDGTIAMVTCPFANYVYVIDVFTSTISTAIFIGDARDIAFDPTGTRAYVSSGIYPRSIKVVDTASFAVIGSYTVNGYPGYIHVSRDGRDLTVMDLDSSNMWFIDLMTGNIVTIPTQVLGGGLAGMPL